MTTSTCCVCLDEDGEDTASSRVIYYSCSRSCFCSPGRSLMLFLGTLFPRKLFLKSFFISFSVSFNFNSQPPFFLIPPRSSSSAQSQLTLSKMPHSQMSCSLALVLIAMVKRMCGMSSWEKEHQYINQLTNQSVK